MRNRFISRKISFNLENNQSRFKMADWCYYAVGYNGNSILEEYESELVEEKAGGDREDYEEGYGYSSPLLYIEQENISLFYPDAKDEDDAVESGSKGLYRDNEGELLITNEHINFGKICGLIRSTIWPDAYFISDKRVDWEAAMNYASSNEIKSIHICEVEPPQ